MKYDAAVIGGGVSGLATAYELMCRGHRVVVLERQTWAGGNAVSVRMDGFLMEHGPSSVNAALPAVAALSQSLGLEHLRCGMGNGVRYRYLAGGGCIHPISTHPFGFFTSGYLSLPARLRMMAEVAIRPHADAGEETVAEFSRRRFGREFTERVIDPLVGGLFAARAADLSMPAAFPALVSLERSYGSVSAGMLRRRLAGAVMPGRRMFSWRDGVGTLSRALVGRLGAVLKTGIPVRRIRPLSGGFRVEAGKAGSVETRTVVVATQPHVAAGLLEDVDKSATEAASGIAAPPLATVFLGYRRQQVGHPLDGLGFLIPASEGRPLTGTLFCSTMFPGRAPEGHVAMAAYIGGSRAPDLARAAPGDLVALVREQFHDLLSAQGEPVMTGVRQWPRGLPQYRRGHIDRVAELRGIEQRLPGLFVTGNYLGGLAVANCVTQATETAGRIDRYLADHAWVNPMSAPAKTLSAG